MRIAFFGGSFDPPHRGHLAVAQQAAAAFSLDAVLLAPTANQPLKPGGAEASFADRLAMVALLCEGSAELGPSALQPSAIEAPTPDGAPNYTIDTLTRLRQTLASADSLFVLVGADAFLDLPRWRDPAALLDVAEWIVAARPGFDLGQLDSLSLTLAQRQRVHLLQGVDDPASATDVRALLRSGGDASLLVPPGVLDYIRAHHLYLT